MSALLQRVKSENPKMIVPDFLGGSILLQKEYYFERDYLFGSTSNIDFLRILICIQ